MATKGMSRITLSPLNPSGEAVDQERSRRRYFLAIVQRKRNRKIILDTLYGSREALCRQSQETDAAALRAGELILSECAVEVWK